MNILPPSLVETGEGAAVDDDKTPTQIADESHESASVAWVRREIARYSKACPALKNLRSLRAWFLISAGFVSAAFTFGTVTIRAELRADRAELKEELRQVVREEVGSKLSALAMPKTVNPQSAPLPAKEVVASTPEKVQTKRVRRKQVQSGGPVGVGPLMFLQGFQ